FTWFMNDGYSKIAEMQRMEAVWQKKAPLADISRCDGKPCVKVDARTTYGDKENTWMIIKK
ncbi:mobilization protein, partial [Erwinia tracheiphila PSU-1]